MAKSIRFIVPAWIILGTVAGVQENVLAVEKTFGQDATFLQKHTDAVVLGADQARIVVVPAWQGRVMTSTAGGADERSFGWINYELIESGKTMPHINVYGGEDRFWIGPEGGQFSIFFKAPDPFDLEHWQTPTLIDTEKFDIVDQSEQQVKFRKTAALKNYSGTVFQLRIDRSVRMLDAASAAKHLKVPVDSSVKMVAYESDNQITNIGKSAWKKQTGLLSIWILGMFKHSPTTTVAIPFVNGPVSELGPAVIDDYFGKVPSDRLVVSDDVLFFKADGMLRSKIGITPKRAAPVMGSYDASGKVLTIVQYNKPDGVLEYVNSKWEVQDAPYAGDVVNSYNDGPPSPGAEPLGPFYELESSSPAAALGPGESIRHVHRTFHLEGNEAALDRACRSVLGVSVADIVNAFTPGAGSE